MRIERTDCELRAVWERPVLIRMNAADAQLGVGAGADARDRTLIRGGLNLS